MSGFLRTIEAAALEANLSLNQCDPFAPPDDLVKFHWRDGERPEKAGWALMPRERAELLVSHFLDRWGTRYELSIESFRQTSSPVHPTTEVPVKWAIVLAFVESCLAFARAHKTLLVASGVGLFLLLQAAIAIYLPTAHLRVIPVVTLALGSFILGLCLSKMTAELP